MSKKYTPTELQAGRLAKAVEDFNEVIDRLNKHYESAGQKPIIPKRRDIVQLRENITSYNELRRELSSLRRLTKGKAQDVIKYGKNEVLRYVVDQAKLDIKQANKQRKKYRELLGYDNKSIVADTENLRDRKLPDFAQANIKRIESSVESIRKETFDRGQDIRLERLKQNYILAAYRTLDTGMAEHIEDLVTNIDTIDFARAYINDEIPTMEFFYEKSKMEERYNQVVSKLNSLR